MAEVRPGLDAHGRSIALTLAAACLLASLAGCSTTRPYNSLDLALLPCEQGDSPIFFRPVEFGKSGEPVFPEEQIVDLRKRLASRPPVTDLIFFVHGWNRNPASAEQDYQNFLCRLHARLRSVIGDEKRNEGLVVVGVFWPSTLTDGDRDPLLFKPVSYFPMRDRADLVAERGLAPLFESLIPILERTVGTSNAVRLQLVGHSFGGRMLVRSLESLDKIDRLVPFLQAPRTVDVVLLNAAMPPARFEWLTQAVVKALAAKTPARFVDTNSFLFNVHSFSDDANRILFPLASLFNDDTTGCAAGACGVPNYPTLCVDATGGIREAPRDAASGKAESRFKAWNVDATPVIFDHTDIYKGRIASLIATLMYDDDQKRKYPAWQIATGPTESRCGWVLER